VRPGRRHDDRLARLEDAVVAGGRARGVVDGQARRDARTGLELAGRRAAVAARRVAVVATLEALDGRVAARGGRQRAERPGVVLGRGRREDEVVRAVAGVVAALERRRAHADVEATPDGLTAHEADRRVEGGAHA